MARLLLTDDEWELIADVFPEPAATGRPRRDHRTVLDAILSGGCGPAPNGATCQTEHLPWFCIACKQRLSRRVVFDKEEYQRCSIVERLIGWLKESRRIFSRSQKTAKKTSEVCSCLPSFGSTYNTISSKRFGTRPSIFAQTFRCGRGSI